AEDRALNKPITRKALESGSLPSFSGSPVSVAAWLDDGEHYLQTREGRLCKVHARTGRAQPFHDPEKLAGALASLPGIGKETADDLARQTTFRMNPQRTGALFDHDNDLYFATFDGSKAVRLTKTPAPEELTSFSPDGQFVAFVRDHNLYVVD